MLANKVLILLYVCVGLVPYLGAADKIHPQTLYISILNITSLGYIFYSSGFIKASNSILKAVSHRQVVFYFLFILLAILSFLQAVNIIQSMITLAEILSQFCAFVILLYLLSTITDIKKFFVNVFIFLCSIELFSTMYPYLYDLLVLGYPINRSLEYRGVSGSVNIISYLLLMKLPFIYYFSITSKRFKWVYIFLSTCILFSIIVIHQTRSAILLSFIVSLFMIAVFYYNFRIKKNTHNFSIQNIFLTIFFPLIAAIILSNLQSSVYDNRTVSVQDRLSSINVEEYSTNNRIRYYSQAIKSIKTNPLFGIGLGNWQLESIETDRPNIESYIIPYHVHSDFLEIAAETGILGGILYYMVIMSIVLFLLQKIIESIRRRKPLGFELLFFTVLGIWIVDSMFNFPYARVLQQIHLYFIFAVIINYYDFKPLNLSINFKRSILFLLFLSLPLVLISSIRLYQSSFDQRVILSHYNLADYSLSLEVIDDMEMEYSDLTVTTIPMKSMKGFFYMRNGFYRDAIEFFNEGTKHNPYLYFSESYKSFAYLQLGEMDSAYHYSKIAFDKLPGNVVHFANHALTLVARNDSLAIKEAYNKVRFKNELHDELYLSAMADVMDTDQGDFVLENFDFNIQSENANLKRGYYTLKIGTKQMQQAAQLNELGDYFFGIGNFVSAEESFREASQINPYEFPYQENYANAQLQLGKFEQAIQTLNDLIDKNGSTSIKAKYMRVLAYLNLNDNENACIYIDEIKNEPLVKSLDLQRFCY